MRRVVVRYKLKGDRVSEHEALLTAVFEALAAAQPEGLRYDVLKLDDGVSFTHIATLANEGNPLVALEAFKRFTANLGERCEVPPSSSVATLFASHPPTP